MEVNVATPNIPVISIMENRKLESGAAPGVEIKVEKN